MSEVELIARVLLADHLLAAHGEPVDEVDVRPAHPPVVVGLRQVTVPLVEDSL